MMLRILLGALGVALIALGFSSDETLGWLGKKTGLSGDAQPEVVQLVDPAGSTPQLADVGNSPQLVSPALRDQQVGQEETTQDLAQTGAAVAENQQPVKPMPLKETPIAGTLVTRDEARTAATVAADVKKAVPDAVDENGVRIDIVPAVAELEKQENEARGGIITAEDGARLNRGAIAVALSNSSKKSRDDTLFVLKKSVNLREGPSIDYPVVLEMDVGQELMEFKRKGKWVHVGAYGTSGTIGWVHQTLVSQQN